MKRLSIPQGEFAFEQSSSGFLQCCFDFLELAHQLASDGFRFDSARLAELIELNHVQATLAQFQSPHQAVLPAKFLRQLPLGESRLLAQRSQRCLQAFTLAGVNGFIHVRILRAAFACFQNAGRPPFPRTDMNAAILRWPSLTPYVPLLLALAISPLLLLGVNAQPVTPSLAEIKIAAESGDPAAQDKLAEAFAMRLDSAQAEAWYRKAAGQGYVHAQAKLGNMLLLRNRTSLSSPVADRAAIGAEAVNWLLLAANQGDRVAQADLASVYLDGKLLTLDLAEAYKWGDLAAKGSSINVATITGRSCRDAAILKMRPDQIDEARRRVASFVPHQLRKSDLSAAPAPPWLSQIKLMGLGGAPGRRFAIVNKQTLQTGDTSAIKVGTNTVTVRCLEIRDASVIVSIDGLDGTRELRLP